MCAQLLAGNAATLSLWLPVTVTSVCFHGVPISHSAHFHIPFCRWCSCSCLSRSRQRESVLLPASPADVDPASAHSRLIRTLHKQTRHFRWRGPIWRWPVRSLPHNLQKIISSYAKLCCCRIRSEWNKLITVELIAAAYSRLLSRAAKTVPLDRFQALWPINAQGTWLQLAHETLRICATKPLIPWGAGKVNASFTLL